MARLMLALLAPLAWALKMREDRLCSDWDCGKGYMPKIGHNEIVGSSNAECCEKTCALWMCGQGYVKNEEYSSNVAQSDQQCCDEVCSEKVECAPGWALNPAKLGKEAGNSAEACCTPSCSRFTCPEHYQLKVEAAEIIGNDTATCCNTLCSAYECPKGYKADPSASNTTGSSPEECCMQECALFDHLCPQDTGVPPEKRCELGRSTEQCCKPKCKLFDCSAGWAHNQSADGEYGESDQACCTATCKVFDCPAADGWINASLKSGKVGQDAETCCDPACSRYECSAGWAPNPEAKDSKKTGDEACCLQTCELHTCSKSLVMKPNAKHRVGNSDEECCEPAYCDYIRTKLSPAEGGCQTIGSKDDLSVAEAAKACHQHYYVSKQEKKTVMVECSYSAKLKLCRNKGKETAGCHL